MGRDIGRETGWLIEVPTKHGPTEWLKAYRLEDSEPFLMSPTQHAHEALRFARRCDAETFLHNLLALHRHWQSAGLIITDHEWMQP